MLVPHNAHYAVKLLSARSGSNVERVVGDMVIQWERDCSGWTMNHRTVFDIAYSTGSDARVTMEAATWEAARGDRYTFNVRTLFGDKVTGRVEGYARRGAGGAQAVFTEPEPKVMPLPADVLFPTQHTRRVLAAATSAPMILPIQVFDGFTENGALLVNAAISHASPGGPAAKAAFPPLAGRQSWIVQLAFFAGNDEAEPESEIGMRLYDNGISEWLDMDFGDFRVRADLVHLALAGQPDCRNN